MDDKKLESQKTVVAFVAGLLIGGLLVWVFSASPDKPTPTTSSEETPEGEMTNTEEAPEVNETEETPTSSAPVVQEVTGDFSFSVADQSAGTSVSLGDRTSYPTNEGWIVVHEDVNGSLGNALGAARFNTAAGLAPQSVSLLRGTTAGKNYQVVFYSENGDRMFDIREDAIMMRDGKMISDTFAAN